MNAKQWDNLKIGDRAKVRNGVYSQDIVVTRKEIDRKGMRWVGYRWIAPNKQTKFGTKRYLSVYLYGGI